MKLITVAGPPSSGKTAVIISAIKHLEKNDKRIGVVKFDCLSTEDEKVYRSHEIEARTGLSGGLCPDHFYVSNVEEALSWSKEAQFDYLVTESAGLCNRCSPYIKDVLAVCVIDNLSGVHTPKKIGPMLKYADIVVITKGDIVSQAERDVFSFRIKQVNPAATVLQINGITGQGSLQLARMFEDALSIKKLQGSILRFTMPGALCSYCLGEREIGPDKQIGVSRLVDFRESSSEE